MDFLLIHNKHPAHNEKAKIYPLYVYKPFNYGIRYLKMFNGRAEHGCWKHIHFINIYV